MPRVEESLRTRLLPARQPVLVLSPELIATGRSMALRGHLARDLKFLMEEAEKIFEWPGRKGRPVA